MNSRRQPKSYRPFLESLEERECPSQTKILDTTFTGNQPFTLTGVHALEKINVQVELLSTDNNENGEGEILHMSVNHPAIGSLFEISLFEYNQPRSFTLKSSVANPVLTGDIQNSDGDESCHLIVTVGTKEGLSQPGKDALFKLAVSYYQDAVAEVHTANEEFLEGRPFLEAVFSQMAAEDFQNANLLSNIASDPSDPNFKVIALPVTPPVPKFTAQPGQITQADASAINALLSLEAKAIGVEGALFTSINRWNGAVDAGNAFWAGKQQSAVNQYTADLGTLLKATAGQRTNVANTLKAGGFTPITVSPTDIFDTESSISQNGLPSQVMTDLTNLGATSADISAITSAAIVQDNTASSGTFPAKIADPALINALLGAARLLNPSLFPSSSSIPAGGQ